MDIYSARGRVERIDAKGLGGERQELVDLGAGGCAELLGPCTAA